MVKTEVRVFDMSEDEYVLIATGSAATGSRPLATMSEVRTAAAEYAVSNALRELLAPYAD
jgi:hypothetical protein